MEEKLAIVSSKVQTTRHRIKGILTEKDYQIIFSDTPGIIEPKYKLHEKMMQAVKSAIEDTDVALYLVDIRENWDEAHQIFDSLKVKAPGILLINKTDEANSTVIDTAIAFFTGKDYAQKVMAV